MTSDCGACGADLNTGGHYRGCGNAGRYEDEEPLRDRPLVEPTDGYAEDEDFVTCEPDAKAPVVEDDYEDEDEPELWPDEDDRPWDTREEHWGLR